METFKASHRYARISARKARYVMDLVRKQPVEQALETLRFTNRRAAPMIAKVVKSAMANAVQEGGSNPEHLVIQEAFVDEGPTWKRWRPRARGMAYPIFKRTSHLTIIVGEEARVAEKASAAPAASGSSKASDSSKETASSKATGE